MYIYIHIYTPGALSFLVTSVVLYSLTRATLMSSGKDETRVCGYIYINVYITYMYIYIYIYIYIYKLKKEKIRPGGYKTQNSEKKKTTKDKNLQTAYKRYVLILSD